MRKLLLTFFLGLVTLITSAQAKTYQCTYEAIAKDTNSDNDDINQKGSISFDDKVSNCATVSLVGSLSKAPYYAMVCNGFSGVDVDFSRGPFEALENLAGGGSKVKNKGSFIVYGRGQSAAIQFECK